MKVVKAVKEISKLLIIHRRNILVTLLVIVALYLKSLFGDFLWDDEEQIVNNSVVHTLSNVWLFFSGSTFNTGGAGSLTGVYYRPIMMLFFSTVYSLFGASPLIFHLLQVLLHVLVTIIGYLLLVNIFSKQIQESNAFFYRTLCLLFALIFAVHPLNVESVAYISAAQDIFYTLFGVLAIYFVSGSRSNKKNRFITSFIFLCLALFSKESALIFLILYLVYGLIFDFSKKHYYLAVSALSSGIYFFVRLFLINISFGKYDISPISALTFYQRLITIPKVILYYISNFFYPNNLSVMQHWVVKSPTISDFWIPLFWLIVMVFLFCLTLLKTRSKELLFFVLWTLLSLGVHSQIYPLDMTVATRWMYSGLFGMIGIVAVYALLLLKAYKSGQIYKTVVFTFVFFLIALSIRSFVRLEAWQNGYLLYSTDINNNPESFDLNNNYGVELYRNGSRQQALVYFEKSIKLQPNWTFPWNNAGVVYQNTGNLEKAKKYYKKSIEISNYHLAYVNYAKVLIFQKKYSEALIFVNDALKYLPNNAELNQIKSTLQSM